MIVMVTRKWERRQEMIVLSTDTVVFCIGTTRDCQCHYDKVIFFRVVCVYIYTILLSCQA